MGDALYINFMLRQCFVLIVFIIYFSLPFHKRFFEKMKKDLKQIDTDLNNFLKKCDENEQRLKELEESIERLLRK